MNFLIVIIFLLTISITVLAVNYLNVADNYKKFKQAIIHVSLIMKSVRYGDLNGRIDLSFYKKLKPLGDSINSTIEALQDREKMINAYRIELQEKKDYLEKIINSLNDGLLIISTESKIISANTTFLKQNHLKMKDVLNKTVSQILTCQCTNDCFKDFVRKDCSHTVITCQESSKDAVFKIFNSDELYNLNISFIGQENYILTLRNITREIELEKLRDDFVATLTHDLKVPILAEATTLEFLGQNKFGELSDKQALAVGILEESNQELLGLVNTILDTYKFENGQIDMEKEPVNISELIKECVDDFKLVAQKQQHKINYLSETSFTLNVDKKQMKRVFKNIINNAFSHNLKGCTVDIITKINGNFFEISIKDNGKGIKKEDIQKIFDRYYTSVKKFRKVGTGLGLYLCKGIVDAHSGKIEVKSEEGKGSNFIVQLPINFNN